MHARIDELLNLLASEPLSAATREHIGSCAVCTNSLRQLARRQQRLRDLPQMQSPDIEFATIQARTVRPPRHGALDLWRVAAAIIACVLLASFAVERSRDTVFARSRPVDVIHDTAHDSPRPSSAVAAPVMQLVAESRALDAVLQRLPPPRQVQRVSFAATVDRLEQRVQWIDMQLSADATDADSRGDEFAHQLWRERVDLMDSLVKVRYAASL